MDNLIEFRVNGDERGQLIALEQMNNVPFDIKRVFYIFGTQENTTRGEHAHYNTKQLLVAVKGSCKITFDDGNQTRDYILDKPHLGLLQKEMIWGSMSEFSDDCVLMVLADDYYKEEDYILTYDIFKEEVSQYDK